MSPFGSRWNVCCPWGFVAAAAPAGPAVVVSDRRGAREASAQGEGDTHIYIYICRERERER